MSLPSGLCYHSRSKESKTPSSVDWVGKLVLFFVLVSFGEFVSPMLTSVLVVLYARPYMCGVFNICFILALTDGFCCAWLAYPVWCWYRCLETGSKSIDWAQLNRFYLKTEAESSLRNVTVYEYSLTFCNLLCHLLALS
jgi:hypothetical protein